MCECVHHIPGRIRFRIPALRKSQSLPRALRHSLMMHDGIEHIEIRDASCSLIIHYDPIRLAPQVAADVLAGIVRRTQPVPVMTVVAGCRGETAADAAGHRQSATHLSVVAQPPVPMPTAHAFRAEPGSLPLEGRLAVGAARYLGGVIGRTIFLVLLQTTMKRLEASTQRAIVFAITGRKPVA